MRIGKSILTALAFGVIAPVCVSADDYVDDIYFNPKKDKSAGATKKNSNYIENFSDMDVDAYNLRGQYYTSPVDTIGNGVGSEDDFVYTQQIQKYYNPTIVLDNEELLADVLENSYGNVEIVYNGFTPVFLPSYSYWWPYRGYYDPWAWNIGFGGWGFGWYDPWYVGPSWSWGWGPSWSFGWNWGPSWGWGHGPGWGPGWNHGWGRPNATWSPNGNRPVRPGVGWAGPGHNGNRPAASPGNNSHSGSKWSIGGNHRGSYGQGNTNNGNGSYRVNGNGNNSGYTIGKGGHRYTGSGNVSTGTTTNRNTGVGNHRTTTRSNTTNSYNSTTQRRSNSTTTTNRSYNSSGRSSGNGSFGSGSFGGGSRGSGGGGRSTGGGGSRGTRR